MATTRLYPPNIAGTIPSFYSTTQGTSLEVPFFMNTTVSETQIKGLRLRLKMASTDTIIANPESTKWTSNKATFSLNNFKDNLIVGNFYKVQLAYVDILGNVGYYSTVAIVKYTSQPTVSIADLSILSSNTVSALQFIGNYLNSDTSEKVYQYKFDLLNSADIIIETSGWKNHDATNIAEQNISYDVHSFRYNLQGGLTYKVQYSVITNNGLIVSTNTYRIIMNTNQGTALNITLVPQLDYENGRVKISIYPILNTETSMTLNGTFILSRCSSKDNYRIIDISQTLELNNISITRVKPYVLWDYAVEDGISYKYMIQRQNSQTTFTKQVESPLVRVWFEDMFLYDGKKQLKIQFNPNVSSFKTVVSDSKKTTLGRQYPFVFRSGLLNYKEFSINGLISYLTDNDELFLSKSELKLDWEDSIDATTSLTDENYYYERIFKLTVLDWLNNTDIKLFKSPQEGNYIVRLTGVSFTPNASLYRLLHSFSCTASEIKEYDADALKDYPLTAQNISGTVKTVNINSLVQTQESLNPEEYQTIIAKYDITEGAPCKAISFYCTSEEQKKKAKGLQFSWNKKNFTIGDNGTYSMEYDDFITAPLYLKNPDINTATGYIELILKN